MTRQFYLQLSSCIRAASLAVMLIAAGAAPVLAQAPETVRAEGFTKATAAERVVPCNLNDAGTLIPGPATAQSNDLTLDTLFLCWNDEILIDHNGDQRLDGDPDPSTAPGVGYAWYECLPSVDGPTLGAVAADPCLIDNPGAPAGAPPFFVSTGGRRDGDILFFNQGAVQAAFNGGMPYLVWFAPITFDDLSMSGGTNFPTYENGGSCVSVSTDAAFAVVYLNELQISNLQINNCTGSFLVEGGMPGWSSNSRYTFDIVNTANPTVRGTVTNPSVGSGGRARFSVPEAGNYTISVTDSKSCEVNTMTANLTSCTPADRVKLAIDTILGAPGATVCVPVTVTGFQDIVSFQFGLDYDEVLLRFDGFQNVGISPFSPSDYNDNGDEVIVAAASFATPYSIPDGGILFEVCFEILGLEGEFGDVVVSAPISGIEFVSASQGILDYDLCTGGVVITTNTLALLANQQGFGCGGENENFFVARVFGGTAPYNVTWQRQGGGMLQGPTTLLRENQAFASPANLAPGTYDITAVDALGNTDVVTLTIVDGATLGVNVDRISDLRCFGDDNGALFAIPTLNFTNVNNPGSNYTFSWSTGAMTQGINNLTVGTYTVTVTDSRGCVATTNTTITAPPALNVNVSVTDATCTGLDDGEIIVTTTGGTPASGNYDYTFVGPDGVPANVTTNNLTINSESGVYQITVVDDNGCREQTTATVGSSRAIGLSESITPISCAGANDGRIVVVASATMGAANPPFMFTWFGAPGANSTNTQSTLPNLGPGTYRVIAEDADGCVVRDTFMLTQPAPLQLSVVASGDESCNPGGDGFIDLAATGGTTIAQGYTYELRDENNVIVSTTSGTTGLSEGSYQAFVIDDNGCVDSLAAPQVIMAPDRPEVQSLDDAQVDCNGATNGILTVAATPGAAPVDRIVWSNGDMGTTIDNLAAGEYIVEIFDTDGCVTRDTALVTEPDVLAIANADLTSPPCFEGGDGAIEVTVTGGTGPYTFTWSDGTTGVGANRISGPSITAGSYVVTVVDANNCPQLQETFTLDDPAGINPTESNIVAASCAAGTNDGGLTVSAELPGDPTATFNFTWSSGETGSGVSSTATMLSGGRITVSIQEASGACPPQEFSYEIPSPEPLVLDVGVVEDVRCFGESNGRIVIDDVVGGTPGYTYTWSYGGQTFNGNELNDIPAGDVRLEIRDANNCQLLETFTIDEPELLEVELDDVATLSPTCAGLTDGLLAVMAMGGNDSQPYTYRWNDDPNRNSAIARDVVAGTYTITVTDFKGCMSDLVYTLTEPPAIDFELSPFEDIVCFGDLTTLTVLNASGGQGVSNDDFQVSINGSSFQPIGTEFQVPGGVAVPIQVIDPAECVVNDEVIIPAPPAISVRLPETVEVELGDSIRLRPDIFPGGAPILFDSIRWTPDTAISFRNGVLADPYVSPLDETVYTITVFDEDGCSQSASVLVLVDRNRNVYIPNAFSPNNDSNNDLFQIFTGPGVRAISYLRVFDRWGETVFSQDDLALNEFGQQTSWDGTFRGRRVPTGVYVYITEISFLDGKTIVYKGDVTVMY